MTGRRNAPNRALVVFVGETELKKLRFLKKGFRHCFAILEVECGWVVYNPLSHMTEINTYPRLDAGELARFYRGLGYRVVATWVKRPAVKQAPLSPYTCVEAVKRALGIHARSIFTPRQLHRYPEKIHKIEKKSLSFR